MKISTKVEYGLVAIIDIALYSKDNQSVNSVQISERHGISKKFLEQIMNSLRTAKLVVALKGSKGGYKLFKPAEKITLTEILNALDVSILSNNLNTFSYNSDMKQLIDTTVWNRMNDSILAISNSITLAELIDKYMTIKSSETLMYYI